MFFLINANCRSYRRYLDWQYSCFLKPLQKEELDFALGSRTSDISITTNQNFKVLLHQYHSSFLRDLQQKFFTLKKE